MTRKREEKTQPTKGEKTRPTKAKGSAGYSLRLPLERLRLVEIFTRTNSLIVPQELYLDPNDEAVQARIEEIREQLRFDQTMLLEAGIAPLERAGYVALKPLETYAELLKIIALNVPRNADKIVEQDFRERGYRYGSEQWKIRWEAWSEAYADAQKWQHHLRGSGGPTRADVSEIENIINQESGHAITVRPYIPDLQAGPDLRFIDASCVPILVTEKDKTDGSVQQKVERKYTGELTDRDAGQLVRRYNKASPAGSLAEPYERPDPEEKIAGARGFIELDNPINITDMSGIKLVYRTEREMRKGMIDFMAKVRAAGCVVAHDQFGKEANEDYFRPDMRKTYRDPRTGEEKDLNYESNHILFESSGGLGEVVEVQFTTLESFTREFFGTSPSNHRVYEAKKGWAIATPKAFSNEGKREAYGANHSRLLDLVHQGWTR